MNTTHKKEWPVDTGKDLDESQKHYPEKSKPGRAYWFI